MKKKKKRYLNYARKKKMTAELYVHGSPEPGKCKDAYMWKWKSSF